MKYEIQVENIKCGGCAGTIEKKLSGLDHVSGIEIDIELGVVSVESTAESSEDLITQLLKMGYPEIGTAGGMTAAAAKAKSFVSCAVGKVDNMVNK